MKEKQYPKIGVWLALLSLIVSFANLLVDAYDLNPKKAKKIACRILVFFKASDSQLGHEFGCQSKPKSKPDPKPKSTAPDKNKPKKQQKSSAGKSSSRNGNKLLSVASIFSANKIVSFVLIHLAAIFLFKTIGSAYRYVSKTP